MENTEKKDTSYHLYGMHPVLEAVLSGRQIEKVLLRQGLEGQQFSASYGAGQPRHTLPVRARGEAGPLSRRQESGCGGIPAADRLHSPGGNGGQGSAEGFCPCFCTAGRSERCAEPGGCRPYCRMCRSRRHHPSGKGRSRYQRRRSQSFGRSPAAYRSGEMQEPADTFVLSQGEGVPDSGGNREGRKPDLQCGHDKAHGIRHGLRGQGYIFIGAGSLRCAGPNPHARRYRLSQCVGRRFCHAVRGGKTEAAVSSDSQRKNKEGGPFLRVTLVCFIN